MAKWGEGDPRWIVEERPDATNVNNWHWTEKNATPWSKDRFQQLFKDLKIVRDDIECNIQNVEKCTGEATANNRKGKLIFFYEWELTLKWQGRLLNGSGMYHKGKATIPNLSEENQIDEVDIIITTDECNDESEQIKQFLHSEGSKKLRELLHVYVKELKEEYSKNLILPKKGEAGVAGNATSQSKDNISSKVNMKYSGSSAILPNGTNSKNTVGCKLDVRSLEMTEEFQCTANDLYNALTKLEMVTAFTRSSAQIDATKGGEFHLYGGNVNGKFEELVPEKKILLSWRLKSWPNGHYSKVSIELEEMKNCTQLSLQQSGIPASEYDSMRSNWYRYYWHSIKQTFGFGSPIADFL